MDVTQGRQKLDTPHQATDVVDRLPSREHSGNCLRGIEWQPHRHDDDELFYLLDGEAVVQVGEDMQLVAAGDLVFIPRDVVHAIWPARAGETFHAFSLAVNFAGECAVTKPLATEVSNLVRDGAAR
jgi:mannose-6-phosphate isomerase-like protein (cupin superfamily)